MIEGRLSREDGDPTVGSHLRRGHEGEVVVPPLPGQQQIKRKPTKISDYTTLGGLSPHQKNDPALLPGSTGSINTAPPAIV